MLHRHPHQHLASTRTSVIARAAHAPLRQKACFCFVRTTVLLVKVLRTHATPPLSPLLPRTNSGTCRFAHTHSHTVDIHITKHCIHCPACFFPCGRCNHGLKLSVVRNTTRNDAHCRADATSRTSTGFWPRAAYVFCCPLYHMPSSAITKKCNANVPSRDIKRHPVNLSIRGRVLAPNAVALHPIQLPLPTDLVHPTTALDNNTPHHRPAATAPAAAAAAAAVLPGDPVPESVPELPAGAFGDMGLAGLLLLLVLLPARAVLLCAGC